MKHSAWVGNANELAEFVTYVYLSAPDRFVQQEHDLPSEQMNLDRAFEVLYSSMHLVRREGVSPAAVLDLQALLQRARMAYASGEAAEGGRVLQQFQKKLRASLRGGIGDVTGNA